MSGRLFRGTTTRKDTTVRGRARALLVLGGAVGLAGVLGIVAQASTPPAFDATAKVTPGLYYVNDTVGSVYTFTVTNTGTTAGIGAVEIRRPSTAWSVSGCVPPAGWTSQRATDKCRYVSASSTSDDLKPGKSMTFKVGAKTAAGNVNQVGTWPVVVSKSNNFATPSLLRNARSTGSGLTTVQHVFELTTAVVSDTLKAAGTSCPTDAKDAVVGTTTNVIVCGRNRANVALAPTSAYSSLTGTFLKSSGAFSSATIQPNSGNVVLARWSGAVVSDVFGSGKKVVTQVGSASNRTSPLRTFTGYNATSSPPVAIDDVGATDEDTALTVAAPGVLGNDTNAEAGETLTAGDVTGPSHGTLTLSPNGAYTYTPNADFAGTDSFTYKTFDTYTKSGSATVTITVNPVNDAPVATVVTTSTPEDTAKVVILDGADVDSPSLTYTIVTNPTHGSLGAVVGNAVTYTPNANYNGPDSFTYKVGDGSLESAATTVNLTVDAVNDAPVGVDDAVSVGEDAAVAAPAPGILGNDTDVEGSPLTATLVTGPAHASSFTLNPDGSYSYAPVTDFHGSDSFTYRANDGGLDSALTTVTITVSPANDAPTAGAVSVGTDEDTAKAITLTGTDLDGDTLTFSIVAGPSHGSLGAISGDSVTYTPDANYFGSDSFTYKVNDGTVDSAVANVTITIASVNDVPVAGDDAYATDEDTALNVTAPGVLGDDSDVEGPLSAVLESGPSNGTLTLNADGSFTYLPAANYAGPDSFTYRASDGAASSALATVDLVVNAVNDAPAATAATVSTNEDTAKTVTLSGTDVEGSALTYSIVTGPSHGSLGAISGDEVVYTPDANYNGPDSFTFKANDGTADSAAAAITIAVNAVNDAPVQVNDSYVTNEDTALNVTAPGVLANDFDVDNDPLTAVLVSSPSHGTLQLEGDGSFVYTPSANYNGPDSFTYRVSDNLVESGVATVTLSVDAVNDAPATSAVTASTPEDTAKEVSLSGADPVEGSPVTFAIVSGPSNGSLGAISGNTVTYTPDANFNGTDSFTFKANDGAADSNVSTATLTVTAVNDAPSFTKGSNVTVIQDTGAHTAPGWATAISAGPADEAGQVLTFAATATDQSLFSAQPSVAPNGDLTFTPASGVTGSTTVTVTLSDDAGGADTSAPQSFTITISPPNATPVAAAKTASGNEDGGAIPVTLSATDDDGDAMTFTAGAASNGLVTTPAGTSCTSGSCTATVTYTPNANFFGTDTFTYTVNDGTIDSAAVTVTVTVNPVNDAPSFTKGANQFVNEDAGGQTVTGWATGKSAGPSNESAQAVTYEVTGTTNDGLFSVLPTVNAAGDLVYTPAPNANGAATVSVRAVDDGGTANGGVDASPVQTFSISVLPVNDAPSFTKGADQAVLEDSGAHSVSNWASAISKGPGDESAQTLSFTTSNDNNALFSVQPGVTPTGTLVYTPAPNAVGSATVTITLADSGGVANGGDDTSDAQTFTITVNPVNDAPSFATAGDQTVLEDAGARTVNGFVTSTSAGPADESAQTVTVAVTNVTNPTLFSSAPSIANGTLTYTPAADANGVSTVTVRATDDGGTANGGVDASPTQTFTITVTPVNDAPSFTKGADQTVNEDAGAQSVSNWATGISTGPANESAQTVTFGVTNSNNGLFSTQPAISPTGTLTYTSAANQYGSATVTVTIADNGGTANGGDDTSDAQTFTITVNPVNDAPVAAAKAFTVQANMKVSLSGLLTGATDPNDSPVPAGQPAYTPSYTVGSISAGAGCVGCTISNVNNAAGTFDFDPPAGGTGTYTVTYTVVDSGHPAPGATSAPQTITFTVNGPVIWFVDTTSAAGGTGRLSAPFNNLPSATTAMGTDVNERIFVRGGNVTGNVTLPTDGWILSEAVTAPAGDDFDDVMGISPPAGTIARPAINGTQRTLSGTVTVGTNSRVRGFDISSGSANGLVGSGKTGLVVNQVSVTSTTGRAVDMANSSGVFTLTRVSSNGATRGISLVNTNVSTGSFTVTGTGTAGSGGTITNSTATGATGFGNNDGGIYLNNTRNVSLDRMNVTAGQGSGIYGTEVTGFSLANSTLTNNGSDVGKDHDGIHFDNVYGTVSVANSTITGSKENNVRFRNQSGTSTISVTGSTMSNNDPTIGANGLILDTYNNATATLTATGNTLNGNNTDGIAVYSNSSGTMNATIGGAGALGNTLTGNQIGVDLGANGTGPSTFVVDNATVTGCATCGTGIHAYKGSGATGSPMVVTIRNSSVDNLGSELAAGIWLHGEGAGALRGTVTGNRVRGVEHFGIYGGIGNGGNATMDLNITGNDVDISAAGPNAIHGIFVESGLLPTDANVTCANIKSNVVNTVAGIDDIGVMNFQSGAFRLPGFPGGSDLAVETFIVSGNTAPVTADANSAANAFTGGAACNTP